MADKGYKAFRPGFYCEHEGNRKQYYENTIAEDIGANGCCQNGVMHYCETPLDTLDYYPLMDNEGRLTEFAEVEPLDKVYSDENKRACRKLKIGAKLNLKDLIAAQIGIVFRRTEIDSGKGIKKWIASQLAASCGNSIAAGIGRNNIAKAAMGSWIVLAEYGAHNGKCYPIGNVRAAQIDGKKLKPDTWYKLEGGEFVEVTDD